jgi:hypothetical protein
MTGRSFCSIRRPGDRLIYSAPNAAREKHIPMELAASAALTEFPADAPTNMPVKPDNTKPTLRKFFVLFFTLRAYVLLIQITLLAASPSCVYNALLC